MPRSHIREVEVQLHSFLTFGLTGGEWSASRPGRVNLGKEPLYPLAARAGLESAHPSGIRTPDRPAHSLVSIPVGYASSTKHNYTIFHSLRRYLQENTRTVPRFGHDRFLPNPFKVNFFLEREFGKQL
jgi:hypothetical protein